MYVYNYMNIWRAARNVKNPPANNYGSSGMGGIGGCELGCVESSQPYSSVERS